MKALLTRFSITTSPATGAVSGLKSLPGWPGLKGEEGSVDMWRTCTTGRPAPRHARSKSVACCSRCRLFRRLQEGASKPRWRSTTRSVVGSPSKESTIATVKGPAPRPKMTMLPIGEADGKVAR